MLSQFAKMAPEAPWDSLCGMLQSWSMPRLGSIRGEEDLAARDQIKAMRARSKRPWRSLEAACLWPRKRSSRKIFATFCPS
jgi:hypothetical protein